MHYGYDIQLGSSLNDKYDFTVYPFSKIDKKSIKMTFCTYVGRAIAVQIFVNTCLQGLLLSPPIRRFDE